MVLVVAAGLVQWLRPLPPQQVHGTAAASITAPGPAVAPPWPAQGEAALAVSGVGLLGGVRIHQKEPIASLAKMMTAFLVLADHPLAAGSPGPELTVTAQDAAIYRADAATQQSVAPVAAGEQLSELQCLQALLIPSANNIADLLARWDAGSIPAFVRKMNAAAARLKMRDTVYTDPSGLDPHTVSTAADQLVLVQADMLNRTFATIVRQPSVTLPVAGTLYNFDFEVGHDGFIGVKTGSDAQAKGCWAFAAVRTIAGAQRTVLGVVLGQRGAGGQLIQPALDAGKRLADSAPRLLVRATLVTAGTVVGYLDAPWRARIPLVTTSPLVSLVIPGTTVRLALSLVTPSARTLPKGAVLGHLHLATAFSTAITPVVLAGRAPGPGLKWRLTRL